MTRKEIRQKAIECVGNLETMCASNLTFDSNFKAKCADNCPYAGLDRCDVVYGYEHGFADGVEEGRQIATTWIPVTERLPKCEETVLITVECRPIGGKPYRRVVKALYEDGNMNTEDSGYCWDTSDSDWEYDEESDGYVIPEGWWEDTDYCEELFGFVGDFVIAWMPLPESYKEEEA